MTKPAASESHEPTIESLSRLLRERDQLFLLHEALADVERARTSEDRLNILAQAIQRLGYGHVETIRGESRPEDARVAEKISNSWLLESNTLVVPLRAVDGTAVATLLLHDPVDDKPPTLARVRTIELFAQQVASIIENARLYTESERERKRGEAIGDIARAVSGSLRLADVMQLSLRHAVALLRAEGATLGLIRDANIVVVAGIGIGEALLGAPIPLDSSISGQAIHERRAIISNDANVPQAYAPSRIAANIERSLAAPLFSVSGAIGVLSVINRAESFTTEDAIVLQRLADQVAVAVQNARLYEDAQAAIERYRHAVEHERRAREAVAQTEARYARLVESASDGIFTVDADGILTSANRSLEQASGKKRAELIGKPFVSLVDARDVRRATQALQDSVAGGRRRVELRYPATDGEIRMCSLTLTPLNEGAGVGSALGVVRDVTDERRMTEQLMQQEKLAAVGELVSGVAHELNNPLASVMAFAQLLLAAPPGAPVDRDSLDAINQEAKRAAKIVANLLTFARQHQAERSVTDLNQVVQDTLDLRAYTLRTAHIELETHLDPELPVAWADPYQLQQVLLNLVTNAEHALSGWSGPQKISVVTERRGASLVIQVSDTGPGIRPEHLSRIFNPFFTTKPVGEGTGLGLSISDGIVREHGGRLHVVSTLGQGATFTVEVPYVAPPASTPVAVEPASSEPQTLAGKRLLIVDDEPAIRAAITRYFRSLGHTVDGAATGGEGLSLAMSVAYDAVMLDIRLPDIMGDEVLAEMERRGCVPPRVVFVTGDIETAPARRQLEAAGWPVVGKPFSLDHLAQMVLDPVLA